MRISLVLAAIALTGCNSFGIGPDDTERSFAYKSSIAVGDNKEDITISVAAPVGVPLETVRESVRYQATRHCLKTFGDSDADWMIDPASGDWAFTRTPDAMIFRAQCQGR